MSHNGVIGYKRVVVADRELDFPRVFPRRLPTPTRGQLARRAAKISWAATHHGAPGAASRLRRRALSPAALARSLRLTFEELGATFVKLGQLIGSSPGVFGDEVADEFRSCLDTGPLVPFDLVRDSVEADLGMALEDAFTSFDRAPIGRASIAVVHRAVLPDGRPVAVKVLRPGVEETVATDLDLLQPLLELLVRQTGDQMLVALLQQLDGFRTQLGEELDLRNEARAMRHYLALLARAELPLVTVPEPFSELSGARTLTMEFLDGIPVDDLARIPEFGFDPKPLVEQVVRAWFITAIRWGIFHGDVHAGNLMLLRDGRIGVLDWGIVGRLDPATHWYFMRILEAALGDDAAWGDVAAYTAKQYGAVLGEMGLGASELTAMIRGMVEPMLTRPFGQVSVATLLQAPQDAVNQARGGDPTDRSLWALVKRLRYQRRLQAMVNAQGVAGSAFDRGTFLLSKQLLYFERYGRMFLADTSLLDDRQFFATLLAEVPSRDPSPTAP
jgi:predicted unusual protein kinase regulating ubiquinone biosynthesis (AarF/ABC1/UbiB family)